MRLLQIVIAPSTTPHAHPRRVPHREGWAAAALLLLVLVVTQYDVLFLGRSLITSNFSNPLDYRGLSHNYGPNYVPHEEWTSRNLWPYANIRDPGATWWQWEPSTQFLKQAMHLGEWPFWDPYIAGGTPAMANLVPAFFFPPYTLVVALGASAPLLNAYFLLLVWGAAFLTFLFIRRHGLTFIPASAGALVVMLSGATHQHLGTFIGQTAACLPLSLFATRVFLDRPDRWRVAGLAVTYAVVALASFPPLLVAIFGITSLYALAGIVMEHRSKVRGRTWRLWILGATLSMGLVSFYYLPALALRAATPQLADVYRNAGLETMPIAHLYQILSPTLVGGIQTYLIPPVSLPGAYIPHAGLVAVALALLARSSDDVRWKTLLGTCVLTAAAIILKLTGSPLLHWIGALPVLNEIHIAQYFGIPLSFLLACLAALGAQALLSGSISAPRALAAAVGIVLITESVWQFAEQRDVFSSAAAAYWLRDWRVLAVVTVCAATGLLAGAVVRNQARPRTFAVALLTTLIFAEGLYNGWYPNPAAWSIFENPVPVVRAVQEHGPPDRMFSFGVANANLNSAFGVFGMDSLMAFNPPRAYHLYMKYSRPPHGIFMREARAIPPDPVLDRANIALIGVNRAFQPVVSDAKARGYYIVFDDGFMVVFRRPTLPKFFFSSEYRVVPQSEALESIAQPNSREIILESAPGVVRTGNSPGDPAVRVEAYRRNSVTLLVHAPRPGLVYASESFFDGWTARVNGAPADILPANYAFRAVAVPAGPARIEFYYWPPGLTTGLLVSGCSLLVVIGLALIPGGRANSVTPEASARRTRSAAP